MAATELLIHLNSLMILAVVYLEHKNSIVICLLTFCIRDSSLAGVIYDESKIRG